MESQVSKFRVNALEVLSLANEHVRVDVIPEIGANISRLQDLKTGREWLWVPDGSDGFRPRKEGTPFDEANLGGIDECIPTIAPCHWRGRDLPDHGEAWSERWETDELALARNEISTQVRLPISPLRFRRSVSLQGRHVSLHYGLENLSDQACEYLWAFHPNFAIARGDRIELPAGCTEFQTEVAMGCPLGPRGTHWRWPEPIKGIRLDRMDFGSYGPAAIKLFTTPLSTGYAAIRNDETGEMLKLLFDSSLHNTLGVWLTRGGWRGHHHLALEPTNGAPDGLDIAVTDWKRFAILGPRETRTWKLEIVISAGGD